MKSITVLFPLAGETPVGGFKVACEYANRLCQDNFEVHIAYQTSLAFKEPNFRRKARRLIKFLYYRFIKGYSCSIWFPLDKRIKEHFLYSLDYRRVPKTDYYIATAVETAFFLRTYDIPNRNKLYLIQDLENWNVPEAVAIKTYNYGFQNIVVSHWLADIVKAAGANCTLIPNGFDFENFTLVEPICKRNKLNVAMMYSTQERKGCEYGLAALASVKEKHPELKVTLFGVHPKPKELPLYIQYYQMPDKETHNKIYNKAAIFLAPSTNEGWGLPVGEAMICGCAVVCTDNRGFREMAENEVTALMSPVRDAQSLAKNIIRLINDDSLRISIAKRGTENIRQFNWEDSFEKLKTLLRD